jgi:hypothetical protein
MLPKLDGQARLRIHIDSEDAFSTLGQCVGEIHRRGRFRDPAFLIRKRNDEAHSRLFLTQSEGWHARIPPLSGREDGYNGGATDARRPHDLGDEQDLAVHQAKEIRSLLSSDGA